MKYNIENNIDFYKELYKSLDENNNDKIETDVNVPHELCLISSLPLMNNFVELKCGHKFNYDPLYKDIFNYKRKFNHMEQNKAKLKQNQIRCPYCRNVQDELLPYHENLSYPKEYGVNFFDPNLNYLFNYTYFVDSAHQCQYQNVTIDVSGNSHVHQCTHYGHVYSLLKTKYNDENKYCYQHKLAVLNQKRENLKNEKAKKMEEKNKLKLELIQQKKDLKNKKVEIKDNCDYLLNQNFCNVILKIGKNKGTQCSGKIYENSLCKRHCKIENVSKITHIFKKDEEQDKDEDEDEENEENIVIG